MAAVFLFGVFWKRTTTLAANMALTLGTVFSIGVGILYLWVFPTEQYNAWYHFMLLSFYLFVIIGIGMIVVSLWDKSPQLGILNMEKIEDKPARIVLILWGLLIVTMIGLYIFFNSTSFYSPQRTQRTQRLLSNNKRLCVLCVLCGETIFCENNFRTYTARKYIPAYGHENPLQ